MPRHQDSQKLFLSFLAERSSVRSYDPERSIPVEDEERIVEAAQKAPSSFNLQMYSFISVKDREKRRKIAELADKQWFIMDAGVFLVVCADLHKMELVTRAAGYDFYQSGFLESFLMASVDAAIAGLTAAFAAESLGYGTCMIGGVRNYVDKMVELLELPKMVYPLFGVCIGYPCKKNPSKQRLPVSGVCFDDVYNNHEVVRAIMQYDETMANSGIYRGREFPIDNVRCLGVGRPRSAMYGWIEHSARRISTRDTEKVRNLLREHLETQGFRFQ
jgi:nitroreductase